MKSLTLLFFSIITAGAASAQAYEGSIEYNKKKQQAVQIDYSYSPEAVEKAIVQRMEKLGNKAKVEKGVFNKDKGFLVFKNAFVTDISDNSMDYMIKVESKSRKEKNESVVYMVMTKDDANAIAGMDATGVGKAKSFLNNLLPDIEAADLEIQIDSQDETVVKAEKKYKNLQDDQQSLEKKIKNLQSDLEKNIKDQENQQKEIDNQKQVLENLRGKRKVTQ